jgi:hypothetical protein
MGVLGDNLPCQENIMEDAMKRLLRKFEDVMVAVTFAEAGEYDEVKRILNEVSDEKPEELPQEAAETA